MDQDNAEIERIFSQAADLRDADECSAFLDTACGQDEMLRAAVERLLKHDVADSFLESPIVTASTLEQPSEQVGTMIGPYKLIEEIGEGGMGNVFMAMQKMPVRRTVALKVIKPGMDSKQVVSRFEAERQALALMDHPSIARVFDGGSTVSGRPYFVMELVRGTPITGYCDRHKLTARERLELFGAVCQAVQHAHQKGVIHRDLKPSNIMVTLYDGKPMPKVIDFGIAKATGGQLSEATLVTNYAQMIGTPQYMSPEQAELTSQDVDTRSDVYSLGVLLYELLTGTTPLERERMSEISFDELRRIIREEEPPTPSTRLSTLDAASETALEAVSQNRLSDPRTLSRQIRGELDWIVMKALEKDRTRRCESASELAKDVQRYLDDEPVEACPPSTVYLLKKAIRRHKTGLAFAATVALAMMLGLIGTTWQAVRATEAEAAERAQSQLTDEQRQAAEANYVRAREAVKQLLTRVADEELAAIPEMSEVRQKLMEDARLFYDELIKLNPDDAQAYFERAEVRDSLADPIEEVIADYEKAIELDSGNAQFERSLSSTLRYRAFDIPRALKHAQRAVELAPDNVSYLGRLAELHHAMNEYDKALAIHERAISLAPTSAIAYALRSITLRIMGNHEDALADARKAIELDPTLIEGWVHLSHVLVKVKNYGEALDAIDRAIEIDGPDRKSKSCLYRDRSTIHKHLGDVSNELKDLNHAIRLAPNARLLHQMRGHLLRKNGDTEGALRDLNQAIELGTGPSRHFSYTLRAKTHTDLGNLDKALADYDAAVESSPEMFYVYIERAGFYSKSGRYEKAIADYSRAIELAPRRSYEYKRRAWLHFELGRYDEALADIAKAVELNRGDLSNLRWIPLSQVATCPNERFRTGLLELADKSIELTDKAARAYAARGHVLATLGHEEEAHADLKTAFDTIPITTERSELNRSATCEELGYLCGELAHRQDVIPYLVKLVELNPKDVVSHYRCALAHLGTGQPDAYRDTCRAMLKQFQNTKAPADGYWTAWTCLLGPEAVDDYAPVVRLAERAVEAEPKSAGYRNTLGAILYRAGRADEAVVQLTEAHDMIENPTAASTTSPAYNLYFLAMVHHQLGHDEEAQKWLEKANEWTEMVVRDDESGAAAVPWNRKLTLKLLREEAVELLGKSTAAATDSSGGAAVNSQGREPLEPKPTTEEALKGL